MENLIASFVELVRLTATDLPPDVEQALRSALGQVEQDSSAAGVLEAILENCALARSASTPICQDTGTPVFYIRHPKGWSRRDLRKQVRMAVSTATARGYLRPNAVDTLTGENTGSGVGGDYFPLLHFEEHDEDRLIVDLLLKGGGCENVGAQYALPDQALQAGRDLDGVYRAALDAVFRAQGRGCAPGILGIAVGGDRASSYLASRKTLLRRMGEPSTIPALASLERRILCDANRLGIGPMGFGGKTTLLAVHAAVLHRLPASYFVSVSYMCWAFRRRRIEVSGSDVMFS